MLKNLLALLLSKFYSKKESSLVAKQSYPSTATTTISLTPSDGSTNKEISYTPPNDGYIVLRDQGLPQSSSYLITGQYAEGVARGDNILFDLLMMTPVLKGVPVTIRYCGKDSVAQFIKNIGGGYSRIILLSSDEGGKLCLKSLSPCSQTVSLRTNPSGLGVKHTLQGGLAYQLELSNMSLQRMDGWGSISPIPTQELSLTSLRMGQMGRLSQEKLWSSPPPQVTLLSLASCLLRRATGLSLVVLSKSFGSHQQWGAKSNLSTGGALC
jgi:hypothetical protein